MALDPTHQRTLIRRAARAALLHRTPAEDRVSTSRFLPWKGKDLPAIAVYTTNESVDPASEQSAPRVLTRRLELAVEGLVQISEAVDDELDALALAIERAMHADEWLGDTVGRCVLTATDIDFSERGNETVGHVRLVYAVTYETEAPEAGAVDLKAFKTLDVHYNPGASVESANQAEDQVNNLDA